MVNIFIILANDKPAKLFLKYNISMKLKPILLVLTVTLLLSGCSSSSSSSSDSQTDSTVGEVSDPEVKPVCTDTLDAKKIDRNPEAFVGKCGKLYIKVIDAQRPEDCQVRANYDSYPFEYGDFESYMNFFNCEDALDFYTDDSYEVNAIVRGSYTFKTVLGATRTLADLEIVEVIK
jgi:hypothetical protein